MSAGSNYRMISFSEDIQLNVVSMQKMLLKDSDLGQVRVHVIVYGNCTNPILWDSSIITECIRTFKHAFGISPYYIMYWVIGYTQAMLSYDIGSSYIAKVYVSITISALLAFRCFYGAWACTGWNNDNF